MHAKNPWDDHAARRALREIFDAAVASASPAPAVVANLPEKPRGRCVVVGAGKASAAMAAALENAWTDVPLSGVISTRYGHGVPTRNIEIIEAAHPVPDESSANAAQQMLAAVAGLGQDDLVLALMSGGGSATLALPIEPLTLADKQRITQQLLASGASISQMNTLRTHLSAIKGGKLAAAANPARVHTLVISDVPGDDPAMVGSGPTIAGQCSAADALAVADRFGIDLPPAVRQHLKTERLDMPLKRSTHRIVASPAQALTAAAEASQKLGFNTVILGDAIEGESCQLGQLMAGIARSTRSMNQPARCPVVIISGGETTVTLTEGAGGCGGRNTEFALALALALNAEPGVWALAGDSDGIDGRQDAAGAVISPDTLARAKAAGLDGSALLARHDSYHFFQALDDLVVTGPTLTNVNDIRLVLVT